MTDLNARLLSPGTLRLQRVLPGPIERVWSFIVDSDKRARWFAGGPLEQRLGGKLKWTFFHNDLSHEKDPPEKHKASEGFTFETIVTRWEPPQIFGWRDNDEGGEVVIELAPQGDKVLLTLTHTKVEGDVADVAAAWDTHTGVLDDALAGRTPRGFWSTHQALTDAYGALFPKKG